MVAASAAGSTQAGPRSGGSVGRLARPGRALLRLAPGGGVAAGAVVLAAKVGRRVVTTVSPSWLDDALPAVGGRWLDDAFSSFGERWFSDALSGRVIDAGRTVGRWTFRGVDTLQGALGVPEWLLIAVAAGVLAVGGGWIYTRRSWARARGKRRERTEPELHPYRSDPDPAAVGKDATIVAGLVGLGVVVLIWLTGAVPRRPLWVPLASFTIVVPGLATVAYGAYWGFVSLTGGLVSVDIHRGGVTLRSARGDRKIRWYEIRTVRAEGVDKPIRIRLGGVRRAVRIPAHGHGGEAFRRLARSLKEGLAAYRLGRHLASPRPPADCPDDLRPRSSPSMDDPLLRIAYVDGPRLRRSLLAACEHARSARGELNRINVFPVPDGDTGTNLALTLRAVSDHLRSNRDRGVAEVAREAARAAVLGARGNCGMMLSHFLLGFAEALEGPARVGGGAEAGAPEAGSATAGLARATAADLTAALRAGVGTLYDAVEHPVEGTILTVMRETAEAAEASDTRDVATLLELLLDRARASLARTPELLPVLRKAGVVDAGAKGFVELLEGVVSFVHDGAGGSGDERADAGGEAGPEAALRREGAGTAGGSPDDERPRAAAADVDFDASEERYRYCTEALVQGPDLPSREVVTERLRGRGDSLLVIRSGDVLKVHVHTDAPDDVFTYLKGLGTLVAHKAEDMRAQHDAVQRAADAHGRLARRPVVVVTDSAADLPEEIVRAHGIHVTPLLLVDGEHTLRDGVDVTATDFHRRLDEPEAELPTTSQPAPADFLETFRQAAEEGEEILGVVLGSALSGTFASAEAAARRFDGAPVHLVDSRGASLLQGLLVLKACELAELAWEPGAVAAELERIRGQSGILFTVDTFDRLLASGRVGRGRAWLGSVLDVKPILALEPDGSVEEAGRVLGSKRVLTAMMTELGRRVPDRARALRFGIVHVGVPSIVQPVTEALRRQYGPDAEILSAPATPVIATHLGVGAWGVAYLVEDGEGEPGPRDP